MKTIRKAGLIGGTSPESTIVYYRRIIEGIQRVKGETILAPLVIDSLSSYRVFDYFQAGDFAGLTDYLAASVERLAAAGAQFASLTAQTPHVVFNELAARSPIPLVSSVECTRQELLRRGVKSVILLGTKFTMESDFLVGPLRAAGIRVSIPEPAEMELIQQRIAAELELGIVRDKTRQEFVGIITRLVAAEAAEVVILGCTELPLLLDDRHTLIPCFDTMDAHIETLVQVALGEAEV